MDFINPLMNVLKEVNVKLNETLTITDDISSFILEYSTKIPISNVSDIYMIFILRDKVKILGTKLS